MIDLLHLLTGAYRPPPAACVPWPLDALRLQAMIYEESKRLHDLLCDRLLPPEPAEADPEGAEIAALLRSVQLVLLRHPVAAQAAFAALIAEGRRFAATPEGAGWAEALTGSELLRKGRTVWDAVGMNMLEDDPDAVVPSAYVEALFRAARSANLDGLLGHLHEPREGGEHAPPR